MTSYKHISIRQHLSKAIRDWLLTLPADLRDKVQGNVFITGGAIASMLMGEEPNDYDVYFRDYETAKLVAEYYAGLTKTFADANPGKCAVRIKEYKFTNLRKETEARIGFDVKNAGGFEKYEKKSGLPTRVFTDNAITLFSKHQLVMRFYGEPAKIHETYDFAHCMGYYDYRINKLVIPEEVLVSVMTKQLVYKGSLYPLCSLFRIRKFLHRGWKISAGQMLKIAMNVQDVNFRDVEEIKDQLMGVDRLFIAALLNAIEGTDADNLDHTWLARTIDELEQLQDDDTNEDGGEEG